MAKRRKPCTALADAISPKLPYGGGNPYAPVDLSPLLVLLMQRLTDSDDDSGVITDFSESFGLNRRAVAAAVKAYRLALGATVH
jgi:hypothetical protein